MKKTLLFQKFARRKEYLLIILINLTVFHKYWLGISTPPWDFLGGGMVEQYRFYKDGGFFNPPSWFPYAWFGIPEYQMVQDGGWFIPVWITAEVFGWHPANAARLQALLILFGSFGMFFLVKTFLPNKFYPTIAASLYTFIPVFYSNAQHYSSVRSAALLPWLLYFLHPNNINKNRFSVFVGAIIIFQTITGSYPGNLIASFYTAIIFIIIICLPACISYSRYLRSLFIMGIAGIAMGLIRYLPVIQLQESFPSSVGNQAGITPYNLIYLILPFISENLPWEDPTLRSMYIGSFSFAALFFLTRKNKDVFPWIFILVVSFFLMAENTLNTQIREIIPFIDISRFAITDWRNTFNLSIIIITVYILKSVTENEQSINILRRLGVFVIALSSLIYFGFNNGHTVFNLALYSLISLVFFYFIYRLMVPSRIHRYITVISLTLAGIIFVFQNSFTWMTTVKEQNFNIYNNSFTNVQQTMVYPMKFRPARVSFLPLPLTPENYKNDQRYNRFWLTGGFGAFGYHNIKDISAYSSLFPRLEKESDPVVSFLMSKSKQLAMKDAGGLEQKLVDCVNSIGCPSDIDVKINQISFDKEREVFRIKSSVDFILVQNEMFSPVWSGAICTGKNCLDVPAYAVLDSLRSWSLPKGDYIFETNATTPLNNIRWVLFYIGFTVALMTTIFPKLNFKRRTTI
jgi:hypothetical protein